MKLRACLAPPNPHHGVRWRGHIFLMEGYFSQRGGDIGSRPRDSEPRPDGTGPLSTGVKPLAFFLTGRPPGSNSKFTADRLLERDGPVVWIVIEMWRGLVTGGLRVCPLLRYPVTSNVRHPRQKVLSARV